MKLSFDELSRVVAENNRSGQDDFLVVAVCYKEFGFDPSPKNGASTAAGTCCWPPRR